LLKIPLESFATVHHFEYSSDILSFLQSHPLDQHQWAFRGQQDAKWKLESSIDRLKQIYPNSFRNDAEEYVRQAFKRRAHHYLKYLPRDDEELEWMALMRHHGAPTRLLEWTRSPYVAAFFAIAEAGANEESALWAINLNAIKMEAIQMLRESACIDQDGFGDPSLSAPGIFGRVFLQRSSPPIVAPVEPARTNERAVSQQGIFLCSNDSMWGFEFALKGVLKSDRERVAAWCRQENPESEPYIPENLFKIYISPKARNAPLKELYRMNINYATLFPGLDGFARSLGTNITVSEFSFLFGDDLDSRL
jgi:FRG domain